MGKHLCPSPPVPVWPRVSVRRLLFSNTKLDKLGAGIAIFRVHLWLKKCYGRRVKSRRGKGIVVFEKESSRLLMQTNANDFSIATRRNVLDSAPG